MSVSEMNLSFPEAECEYARLLFHETEIKRTHDSITLETMMQMKGKEEREYYLDFGRKYRGSLSDF